ncbi:MAG: trypsin-like peptidase domain-containing protein [Pirellula sp.]|jgi:serine protease Do|nr:trypsin-like peptidase domain-containing protein [Pirellula sp.]
MLASAALFFSLVLYSGAFAQSPLSAIEERELLARNQAKSLSIAFQTAANKGLKSVVTVLAKRPDVDETLDELDLLDSNSSRNFNIGSGVILDEKGLCVTNNHVIKDSKGIRVRLSDGRELQGTDLRTDPSSDLAIFRIESRAPLPAIRLGDSDLLNVGDWVVAIGSPFALDQTVSVGIISSKGRTVDRLVEGQLLQTDAAINPGNSGGALLDLEGNLVGINTAIMSNTGVFQGVGFAIPSSRVKWITSELSEFGKVRRAKVGMRVERLSQDLADELQLPLRGGVLVTRLTADGPAVVGGIQIGDVITEIADQKVFTPEDFRSVVEQLPADKSYPVKLIRDLQTISLAIKPEISD